MDGKSLDVKTEQQERLKALFPEAVTEGKIDWEKLRLALGEEPILQNERYVLNWAGKADAFRAIQTPTTATLKPQKDLSIDFDTTENIFIEGENLEVLKVLQKSYYGKIKMIYIDPPYNTGNDSFIYPDKFSESKEEYLKRIGDKDEAGYLTKEGFFRKNSKENGQFHSNWLSMMYPRLFLARNLLREDGVIFVSIDDNEVHNLRLIMNEVFGEENFLADVIWEKRYTRSNDAKLMASIVDHILLYRKSYTVVKLREARTEKADSIYTNPDDDPRGPWTSVSYVSQRTKAQRPNLSYKIQNPFTKAEVEHPTNAWKYSKAQCEAHRLENKLFWGSDGSYQYPRLKKFLSELTDGLVPVNLWNHRETGTIDDGTREVDSLIGKDVFDYPKPTSLIRRMLKLGSEEDAIILDFFAGSGTTAQAVLELNKEDGGNRKFILVQLPEKTNEDSEAFKAGYKTIADICKERIRRVIKKMSEPLMTADENDKNDKKEEQMSIMLPDKAKESLSSRSHSSQKSTVGFKVYTLKPSNFKIWRTDTIDNDEDLKKQMDAFVDPVHKSSEVEDIAWEIMLKSGYELTTNLEKLDVGGVQVFSIAGGELMLALDSINQKAVDEIIRKKPKQLIALDRLFAGNDQLKTNTALQMKDAGIEFKTV
jgi:adenine-specific DNA-methyltransferase